MEKLFAYGSLRKKDIQETIFGRILKGTPDKLIGYTVQEINIEEEFGIVQYPIIVATQNSTDCIDGIFYELSPKEIQLADQYEGMHYKRIQVELKSNEIVWVYTAKI